MNEYEKKMMVYRFRLAIYYSKRFATLSLIAFACSTGYVAYNDDVPINEAAGVVKDKVLDSAELAYSATSNVITDVLWHTGITKTYDFESSAF